MSWPPKPKTETAAQAIRRMQRLAAEKRGGKSPRAPRRTMELDFQEQLVAELRVLIIAPARFWFVPNGGNLSRAQRGRFKAAGLTAGVHDLHFIWTEPAMLADANYHPARFGTLELKAGKNDTSDEQDDFGRDMGLCGHLWAVAHAKDGVDGALATLRAWGVPLRSKR